MNEVVTNAAEDSAPRCVMNCGAVVTRAGRMCAPCAHAERSADSDASRRRSMRAQGLTRREATNTLREGR